MSDSARTSRILRALAVFGVAVPLVLLGVLYAGSLATDVPLGDVISGLTLVTAVAWVVFSGWGRRMDAARPTGELFRASATEYGAELG